MLRPYTIRARCRSATLDFTAIALPTCASRASAVSCHFVKRHHQFQSCCREMEQTGRQVHNADSRRVEKPRPMVLATTGPTTDLSISVQPRMLVLKRPYSSYFGAIPKGPGAHERVLAEPRISPFGPERARLLGVSDDERSVLGPPIVAWSTQDSFA